MYTREGEIMYNLILGRGKASQKRLLLCSVLMEITKYENILFIWGRSGEAFQKERVP